MSKITTETTTTNVNAAIRQGIANDTLHALRDTEARLLRPLVMVLLDPMDPLAAEMMPTLASAYTGEHRGLVPSTLMVIAAGGFSVLSGSTGETLSDADTWTEPQPATEPVAKPRATRKRATKPPASKRPATSAATLPAVNVTWRTATGKA